MDPTLKRQLRQMITFCLSSGLDAAGQLTTGPRQTQRARVEPYFKEVQVRGVQERTTHKVILDETFPATVREAIGMLLWVPEEDDPDVDPPRVPKVIKPCYGERGTLDHWEILV